MTETLRKCNRCADLKPLAGFPVGRTCRGGRRPTCKTCMAALQRARPVTKERLEYLTVSRDRRVAASRAWHVANRDRVRDYWLRSAYGITLDDYESMLSAQGGVCAICGQTPQDLSLCVDHCHATGQVRDLLCRLCNAAVGALGDDPDRLQAAVEYLTGTSPRP